VSKQEEDSLQVHQRNIDAIVSVLNRCEELTLDQGGGCLSEDLLADVRFLSSYKDLFDTCVQQYFGIVAAASSSTSSYSSNDQSLAQNRQLSLKTYFNGAAFTQMMMLSRCLDICPLGAKVHLLKVALVALTSSGSGDDYFGVPLLKAHVIVGGSDFTPLI
jgi:hypothetical protein